MVALGVAACDHLPKFVKGCRIFDDHHVLNCLLLICQVVETSLGLTMPAHLGLGQATAAR